MLQKIENIIDEEMQGVDGLKLRMPLLLSAENWKKTGRWTSPTGDPDKSSSQTTPTEIFHLTDHKNHAYILAPTHEEEITALMAPMLKSYRELPLRVYQIGPKYRDELKPRGLLRCREFLMKDMYSFDVDPESARHTYGQVVEAYKRIFTRLGAKFWVAEADSGDIGGEGSHEFHYFSDGAFTFYLLLKEVLLTDSAILAGEDIVLICHHCGYCANEERAIGLIPATKLLSNYKLSASSGLMAAVIQRLDSQSLDISRAFDAYVLTGKDTSFVCLVPTSRTVNKLKVKSHIKSLGKQEELDALDDGALPAKFDVLIDQSLAQPGQSNSSEGEPSSTSFADIIQTIGGDLCANHPETKVLLEAHKSIEVGHTFDLSTRYSKPLQLTVLTEAGKRVHVEMGCFGIGVSRLIAAVIEAKATENERKQEVASSLLNQHSQKVLPSDSLEWPLSIAPFKVLLLPLAQLTPALIDTISKLIKSVSKYGQRDMIIDDRSKPAGYKLKDAELLGWPVVVVFGKAWTEQGVVEVWNQGHRSRVPFENVKEILDKVLCNE